MRDIAGRHQILYQFKASGKEFDLLEFTFEEGLSTPFIGKIKLAHRDMNQRAPSFVDQEATLTIYQKGEVTRYFSGIVESFTVKDSGVHHTFYEVTLVPQLSRLSLRHNSRIFQEQSVIDIVETLLDERGITQFAWAIKNKHPAREYCVQYRETNLAFIERLLAEEGIYYFFEHDVSGDTVVFSDDATLAEPLSSPCLYHPNSGGVNEQLTIRQFEMRSQLSYSEAILQDRSFKVPSFTFLSMAQGHSMAYQNSGYEYYDYPGRYKAQSVGDAFTQTRLDYLRREALTATGLSDIAAITPGYRATVTDHLEEAFNQPWLVTHVTHEGKQPQALEEAGIDGATEYRNQFSGVPKNVQWKPLPNPKPLVEGPHVAIVKGPPGEEIYVDEFGRVKVKFPWDREQTPEPSDESERTCWIRVSSSWAGAGMGAIALPRVEDEVLVEFLEGDPDQPIITGRSYHALNRQPFRLPDHKTMTGIKTKTHKGEGYNQLSFEDQNEKEQIHFHAEKDMNVAVQNVKNERIEWDHLKSIGHDEKTDIAQDLYVTVDGEEHHTTKKDLKTLIEGKKSLTIEGDLVAGILGAFGMKSEGEAVLASGGSITLKVGSSFVVINEGGVHIQGNEVTVNSGGTPGDVVVPMDPKVLEVAAGEGEAFVKHELKKPEIRRLKLFSE